MFRQPRRHRDRERLARRVGRALLQVGVLRRVGHVEKPPRLRGARQRPRPRIEAQPRRQHSAQRVCVVEHLARRAVPQVPPARRRQHQLRDLRAEPVGPVGCLRRKARYRAAREAPHRDHHPPRPGPATTVVRRHPPPPAPSPHAPPRPQTAASCPPRRSPATARSRSSPATPPPAATPPPPTCSTRPRPGPRSSSPARPASQSTGPPASSPHAAAPTPPAPPPAPTAPSPKRPPRTSPGRSPSAGRSEAAW